MDMRRYIVERLDEIKPGLEKETLRNILEEIFIPLYDHTSEQYARIESRVRDEMPLKISSYIIWTTLLRKENATGSYPYLFPMLEEDLDVPEIDTVEISQRLKSEREIRLDTVFIQADYLVCKEISQTGRVFNATLKTSTGEMKVGVSLRLSKRYPSRVENLYRLFISNDIPWQTINCPYMFKMFDVMLVRVEFGEGEDAGISTGYQADFGEYSGYIKYGFVPVWNVERIRIHSNDFPLAALDKVNYEYSFDLGEEGSEHGYLADFTSVDISAVRREENTLIVTSPSQKGIVWDMYKVIKRKHYAAEQFQFELLNNAPNETFSARMIAHYGTVIKTNAELRRLLESYEVSNFLKLESMSVRQGKTDGETYEVNVFLNDEIRDVAVSKSLLLNFRPVASNSIILRDVMSFLVSQVQLVYPEFNCVGVLV